MVANNVFADFFEQSTIHGFQYLTPSNSVVRRLFWGVLLLVSFTASVSVIQSLMQNWRESPVVTSFDTTSYPIQNIPFPAVTVCPNGLDTSAFLQRVFNLIAKTPKAFKDFDKSIHMNWDRLLGHLEYRIKYMDGSSIREEIASTCHYSSKLWRCMGVYILSQIADQNYEVAHETVFKTLPDVYIGGVDSAGELLMQHRVYPVLRGILANHTDIKCDNCFDWENQSPMHQAFMVMKISKNLEQHLPNSTRVLRLTYSFLKRFEIKSSIKIDKFGTIGSMKHYLNDKDSLKILPKPYKNLGLKQNNASSLFSVVFSLGVLSGEDYDWSRGQYVLENICPDGKNGCYQGPLESLMLIMKDNQYQPHMFDLSDLALNNFTGDVRKMLETSLDIQTITGYEPLNLTGSFKYHLDRLPYLVTNEPFLPYCQWKNKWRDPPNWGTEIYEETGPLNELCNLFRPTITDHGICYSFNALPPRDILKQSKTRKFLQAFESVYGKPDKNQTNILSTGDGVGVSNGLRIILDAHTLTGKYKLLPSIDESFDIALSHPKDFALPLSQGIKIRGGHKVSIIIQPQIIRASEDLDGLSIQERKCRFHKENDGTELFQRYSLQRCMFECLHRIATKKCSCTPWNYPHQGGPDNVCGPYGNICWNQILTSGSLLAGCNCEDDCNQITYSFYTYDQDLKATDCNSSHVMFRMIKDYTENYQVETSMKDYWTLLKQLKNHDLTVIPSYNCEERIVKDIAIVDIFYGSQFAPRLRRTLSANFTDKLASIGGTMGLFCGMSLLSLAELFFFICRACGRALKSLVNPKQFGVKILQV